MSGKKDQREMPDFGECVQGSGINALVLRLMHGYGSRNFSKFQGLGIHPGQMPVFCILCKQEGLSLREMADRLYIKPPTVTVTIQRLEKVGLVCKRPDEKDQRISRIYLTEEGRKLSEGIQRLAWEDEQILTEGFSEDEIQLLRNFLFRMTENLMQASGPGGQSGCAGGPPFSGF